MTKTERKHEAQRQLMLGMQIAFSAVHEELKHDGQFRSEMLIEMSKQMERIEKLFGYEVGSWNRGC